MAEGFRDAKGATDGQGYKGSRKGKGEGRAGYRREQGPGGWKGGKGGDDKGPRRKPGDEDVILEKKFGVEVLTGDHEDRFGFLFNMKATHRHCEDGRTRSGLMMYFVDKAGETFRATFLFRPYFLVDAPSHEVSLVQLSEILGSRFSLSGCKAAVIEKDDMEMEDHLNGKKHGFVYLSFDNVEGLQEARRDLEAVIVRNQTVMSRQEAFDLDGVGDPRQEPMDFICGLFEYDVRYITRVCIDSEIRSGKWYTVRSEMHECEEFHTVVIADPFLMKPALRVFAWDIECTKQKFKFPEADRDRITMISVMVDASGFLLVNREEVFADIEPFEYTPSAAYEGKFETMNCDTEKDMLEAFFKLIRDTGTHILVTFNGDFFDMEFVDVRAKKHGLNMMQEIGVDVPRKKDADDNLVRDKDQPYTGKWILHMDCFNWVQRDSFLPCGSRGLKMVTKAKLKYEPVELDPELICEYARTRPQELATYSVSDAVATYYLYMKLIHNFILALATIIPVHGDDVLRAGSGTLCEALLMAEAYRAGVVFPNKPVENPITFVDGRLVETLTYEGGRVECLRVGVFRKEFLEDFPIDPEAVDILLADLEKTLKFFVEIEAKKKVDDCTNFQEILDECRSKLERLKLGNTADGQVPDQPGRVLWREEPLIYHLDVGAMYPNIILSHRLQPTAMVTEDFCAACSYDPEEAKCQHRMKWKARNDLFKATKSDVQQIRAQLEGSTTQRYEYKDYRGAIRRVTYNELPEADKAKQLIDRVKFFCQKAYKKLKTSHEEVREDIICQRENSFYVDTVRNFRDRRYVFKGEVKKWTKEMKKWEGTDNLAAIRNALDMMALNDSLQLAHKCILNSFYGYVMRKGARWRSMKMAGITTYTGSSLIKEARAFVERVGLPLELDTDGIWCMLPMSFPDKFKMKFQDGSTEELEYSNTVLNVRVHDKYTNHQYQDFNKTTGHWEMHSENSIFFELDGPYKCMVLPASTEEDRMLKKRYAVFTDDGDLSELKGFEMKRRGELRIIQIFQEEIFKQGYFLKGKTREEVYNHAGEVANRWFDVLDTKGANMLDEEVVDLISEKKSMSKSVEDSGGLKATAITCARRLAEILGSQILQDKSLTCHLIISEKPFGAPTTERAVPVQVFNAEPKVREALLKKWLKDPSLQDFDLRSTIDWDYYKKRLGVCIQKIITIPAVSQGCMNPVPRVPLPEWLMKRVRVWNDPRKQKDIRNFLSRAAEPTPKRKAAEIEDLGGDDTPDATARRRPDTTPTKTLAAASPAAGLGEDPLGWVRHQQRYWREVRAEASKSPWATVAQKLSGDFFSVQNGPLLTSPWHIVGVETDHSDASCLHAWVTTQDAKRMWRIAVEVDRKVFVSMHHEAAIAFLKSEAGGAAERVELVPPRNQTVETLLKLRLSEVVFQQEVRQNAAVFMDGVTNMFEAEVPLDFQEIVEVGNCAALRPNVGPDFVRSLRCGSREMLPVSDRYLPRGVACIFLTVLRGENGRCFGAAVVPWARLAFVVVAGAQKGRGLGEELGLTAGDFLRQVEEFQEGVDIGEATLCSDFRSLCLSLNGHVSAARSRFGCCVCAVTSNVSLEDLRREVATLSTMPVCSGPSGDPCSLQQEGVGWARAAVEAWGTGVPGVLNWWEDRVALCRVSRQPLCGSHSAGEHSAWDFLFARRLRAAGCILWASSLIRPDFGITQLTSSDELGQCLGNVQSFVAGPFEYNKPGCYRSICLQVNLGNSLCVCAIRHAVLVSDSTTGELSESAVAAAGGVSTMVSDKSVSPAAMLALAKTVEDIHERGKKSFFEREALEAGKNLRPPFNRDPKARRERINELMDDEAACSRLIRTLYAWICSREALLHDPSLVTNVQAYMKRVFQSLLMEFKNNGAEVISAEPSKLVLATNKFSIESARNFWKTCVRNIQKKQLLEPLNLDPSGADISQCHFGLLWQDRANWSGVGFEEDGSLDQEVVHRWNVAGFLPVKVQPLLATLISRIVVEPQNFVKEILDLGQTPAFSQAPSKALQSQQSNKIPDVDVEMETDGAAQGEVDDDIAAESKTSSVEEAKKRQQSFVLERILPLLQSQLPSVVDSMDTNYRSDPAAPEWQFPSKVGVVGNWENPTLEFIKVAMHIFALEPVLAPHLPKLRRTLLKLQRANEHGPQMKFKDPCSKFVLRNVVCPSDDCQGVTSIDVPAHPFDAEMQFLCEQCDSPFSRLAIEARLVEALHDIVVAWNSQDIKCKQCVRSRTDSLGKWCSCSGAFETFLKKEQIRNNVATLHSIASVFQFSILKEQVGALPTGL